MLVKKSIADHATREELTDYNSYGSMIFLRVTKMIIAPPVVFTFLAGGGLVADARAVGVVGATAMVGMAVERI